MDLEEAKLQFGVRGDRAIVISELLERHSQAKRTSLFTGAAETRKVEDRKGLEEVRLQFGVRGG